MESTIKALKCSCKPASTELTQRPLHRLCRVDTANLKLARDLNHLVFEIFIEVGCCMLVEVKNNVFEGLPDILLCYDCSFVAALGH